MGAFDDLVPGQQAQSSGKSGAFDDLVPQGPKSNYTRAGQEALGVARGAIDPFVGGSQLLMRGLNKIGVLSDEALKTHEDYYNQLEKQYQEATPEGSGLGRVAGNLLVPLPKGVGLATKGVLGTTVKTIQQGALGGALQPVDTSSPETSFAEEKAKQITLGAGIGGLLPTVASAAQRVVSPVIDRVVSKPISTAVREGVESAMAPIRAETQALIERKFPGVDLSQIPNDVRNQLTNLAQDSTLFEAMDPQAIARIAEAKALPVPINLRKGQATKEFMQSQFERETAKTAQGAPIRASENEQNALILKNFDAFIDETGGKVGAPSELGRGVVDPLIKKAKNAKGRISQLYDIAEQRGEMADPIQVNSLVDFLNDNFPSARLAPIIDTVGDELRRLGAATLDDSGRLVATNTLPLNQVERVRQLINKSYGSSAPNDRFGAEAKSIIDQITEGAGGNIYKEARAARAKFASEFENQSAIRDLLKTKPGTTDRAVAYEDVFNRSIINGSPDDLLNLRRSLQTGKAPGGEAAWKDLRAAAVDYLRQTVTSNMQIDELGNRVVSPAAMQKAMRAIGDEKLDVLFGKEAANKLRNLQSVIETLKVSPPGTVNTSGTTSAIWNAMDRVLSMVPGIAGGNVLRGGLGAAKRMAEEGTAAAKVQESLNPMAAAAEKASKAAQSEKSAARLDTFPIGQLGAVPAGDAGRKRRR